MDCDINFTNYQFKAFIKNEHIKEIATLNFFLFIKAFFSPDCFRRSFLYLDYDSNLEP